MITLSQIAINGQIYDFADLSARSSISTLNTALTALNADIASFEGKIWTVAEGGTGQTTANAVSRAFGKSKTAGDSWEMDGYRTSGYITTSKTELGFSISTPYRFYNTTGVTLAGAYKVVQNGKYLFGSSSSSYYNLSGHYHVGKINEAGLIYGHISTGATQSAATNNDICCLFFDTLTITLT